MRHKYICIAIRDVYLNLSLKSFPKFIYILFYYTKDVFVKQDAGNIRLFGCRL